MNGINVSPAELRNAAANLRQYVEQMRSSLDDSTVCVKGTEQSWDSESAVNLRNKYNSLAGKFPDFYDAVTKYAQFLDTTAASYEEQDKKITQSADQALNNGYNA